MAGTHTLGITPLPAAARKKHVRAPQVTIEITQEIIDKAQVRNSSHCVIAEALAAAKPEAKYIAVDIQTIRWTDPKAGFRYTYLTPRRGQVAVVNFDQGIPTEPFTMKLAGGAVTAAGKRGAEHTKSGKIARKAELVARDHGGAIPEVVGGTKSTPKAALSSRPTGGLRRQFGLRAFER